MPPPRTRIPVYVQRDTATTRATEPTAATKSKKHTPVVRRTRSRVLQAGPSCRPHDPTDSPRNPFGPQNKWPRLMDLPPVLNNVALSHLPLVLTIVRAGAQVDDQRVRRMAHVPRNYTITHMRALIIYLFDATVYDGDLFSNHHHVVEICKDADIAGDLTTAQTFIKLSGAQDPYTPVRDDGPEHRGAAEPQSSRTETIRWEGEGDFSIETLWTTAPDLNDQWEQANERRGIIFNFKHNPDVQVHITFDATLRNSAPHPMNMPFVAKSQGRTKALRGTSSGASLRMPYGAEWNEPGAFRKFYTTLARSSAALLPAPQRPSIPRLAQPLRALSINPTVPGKTPDALPAHRKAISARAINISRMAKSAFLRELDDLDEPDSSPRPLPRRVAPVATPVTPVDDDEDSFWGDKKEIEAILAEQMKHAPLSLDDDSDDEVNLW
ncbi:uncharacterized protein SCHCODRAFT_02511944 [Schizophyllum commune H4-8]|uniref:uncharacterized protein n=1 Tax=Schizophyllum commune (strain H4-8 / FGSC 9210) TaxID=578458 RepID=UPI002160FC7A|nr:uncharacterized protein SCHCODRAFT_02511944 [Schizophyllum commune H4-8]KAI5888196.1 hypothetical protein SCHCODRAFT_02511944 [Schizophyllum commune H4-8]